MSWGDKFRGKKPGDVKIRRPFKVVPGDGETSGIITTSGKTTNKTTPPEKLNAATAAYVQTMESKDGQKLYQLPCGVKVSYKKGAFSKEYMISEIKFPGEIKVTHNSGEGSSDSASRTVETATKGNFKFNSTGESAHYSDQMFFSMGKLEIPNEKLNNINDRIDLLDSGSRLQIKLCKRGNIEVFEDGVQKLTCFHDGNIKIYAENEKEIIINPNSRIVSSLKDE